MQTHPAVSVGFELATYGIQLYAFATRPLNMPPLFPLFLKLLAPLADLDCAS